MNSTSNDEKYIKLIGDLRNGLKKLTDKIPNRIFEYEFLIK